MKKINCRDDTMCIFCENWVGYKADVNYLTGECKLSTKTGLCRMDEERNKPHNPTDLCNKFSRSLLYM